VATDVERVLGGVAPHLMVTDPPYGVNYDPAWRKLPVSRLPITTLPEVSNPGPEINRPKSFSPLPETLKWQRSQARAR
jgi:hypothetical protein